LTIRPATVKIIDVARAAGVSRATAAAALSGASRRPNEGTKSIATRDRVKQIADNLGYERGALGAALSLGRTLTIGLVLQVVELRDQQIVADLYQKEVIFAITCACANVGLRLSTILVGTPGSVSAANIGDGRIDGAILATLQDENLAKQIFARHLPTVTIGSGYSERRIILDDIGGISHGVQHLIELGHRKIAYCGYLNVNTYTTGERIKGYLLSMQSHGCPSSLINIEDIDSVLKQSAENRPTAFVCFNDAAAIQLMRRARDHDIKIPDDLSVIGFDNSPVSSFLQPQLTTVDNAITHQSEIAVSWLQSLWNKVEPENKWPIPANLIIRESTAPPPKSV